MDTQSNFAISKQSFSVKDLKCEQVTIFTDRAEVKRLLKCKLNKGENELVLTNISNSIDIDSVRVEGKGNATVLDVVCQSKQVEAKEANTHDKAKKLMDEIKELESNEKIVRLKLDRLVKQINIINDFATTLSKPSTSKSGDEIKGQHLSSSKDNVDNFLNFLDTYSSKLEQLDKNKYSVEEELKEINEKLNVARNNLNQISMPQFNELKLVWIYSISLYYSFNSIIFLKIEKY